MLREVDEVAPDLIVVGGDVAGGPFPAPTIERLKDLGNAAVFIRGNGDREMVDMFHSPEKGEPEDPWQASLIWTMGQIEKTHVEFLAGFEESKTVDLSSTGLTLFCHGSPRSDEEVITHLTPDDVLEEILSGVDADTVVAGHTHIQFERTLRGTRLVNPGSIGMPYARAPGAYWAVLGETVELRRTEYDLEHAARLIRSTDWPLAQEFADENILTVPDSEEVARMFEDQARGGDFR